MSNSTVEPWFQMILMDIAAGSSTKDALRLRGLSFGAFWDYLDAHTSEADRYARAKDSGLEVLADEIQTIADECLPDPDCTGKARLQIDSRKWLLARLKPSRYGDALNLKHSGSLGVKQLIIKDDDEEAK